MAQRAEGQRKRMRLRVITWWLTVVVGLLSVIMVQDHSPGPVLAQDMLPIGQIQGRAHESDYQDRRVRFRAIVTGMLEDENASGTRFYTVFVQEVPGSEDGDPLTSDGLAIFAGARRPSLAIGDVATFGGIVTEFYGLTEIDNDGLFYSIESRNNLLPEPVELDPPADNQDAAAYLERFEGMRVSIPTATVVGPSHPGCGFSVIRSDNSSSRIVVVTDHDPTGQIIGALHPSDVNCDDMPALGTGDQVAGLAGPLTYHFDRFKVVYQDTSQLLLAPVQHEGQEDLVATRDDYLVIATFNVNNHFDDNNDTGNTVEPVLSEAEVALKRAKIATLVTGALSCPDIIGLQEVENEPLLIDLAAQMAGPCGFLYEVSHVDGPDLRGADVALLSKPERVTVTGVTARQTCTELETNIDDPMVECSLAQQPLFSRPPLHVEVVVDGQPIDILVNHFKSKRGGAAETNERRLAQAEYVHKLSKDIQDSRSEGHVLVVGDFNDYSGSAVMQELRREGILIDALRVVPPVERYTYIFDGASQLIDWILVSPSLEEKVVEAGIIHRNADFPYQLGQSSDREDLSLRSSDHDVPFVVIDLSREPVPEPTPTVKPTPTTEPTAEPNYAVQPVDDEQILDGGTLVQELAAQAQASKAEAMMSPEAQVAATLATPDYPRTGAVSEGVSQDGGIGSAAILVLAGLFLLATSILLAAVLITNRSRSR